MADQEEQLYRIPIKYRRMENLHIVFWLFKDIAWCMVWEPLGLAMILPTLIIAIVIAWRTRQYMSELCHNLAVVCWIFANSYWMVSEFFVFDSYPVWGDYSFKDLSIIPFAAGILILAFYYIWYKPRHKEAVETM
ncbi:MAG: hypothetical protein JWQ27_1170 [Ferruginibacter sp.]|nr:hypothetical protein [Ferruginibacter sp.]